MPIAPSPSAASSSNRGRNGEPRWAKPANGKRRPGVLDAMRAELERNLAGRKGSLWERVRRNVIVAGYPMSRAMDRVRDMNAQGAKSLLAMTVAMIYAADIRDGFIGRPRKGGGPRERYTLASLAQFAFGKQTETAQRRAQRALDAMVSLGWAYPSRQAREYNEADRTFISFPGIRRLNLKQLCAITGTTWLLERDRKHAAKKKGEENTILFKAACQGRQERREAKARLGSSNPIRRDRTRSTGDPPGPQALFDIINAI